MKAEEDARKQALRDRLAAALANQGNQQTGTNTGRPAQSTNGQAPVLKNGEVTTRVNDVTTQSKDKADYNKGEDIEN